MEFNFDTNSTIVLLVSKLNYNFNGKFGPWAWAPWGPKDTAPWPAARTKTSRAERMLAIIGALACASFLPEPGSLDSAGDRFLKAKDLTSVKSGGGDVGYLT